MNGDQDHQGYSDLSFHNGEAFLRFAGTYNNVQLMLVEMVQNAIDVDADRILICIDFHANNRNIVVADNGSGVTVERFNQALRSVAKGVKSKDKLGRFGLGLISPLDKCSSFIFTSAPSGRRQATSWTFRGEDIRKQHVNVRVPCRQLPTLPTLAHKFGAYAEGEFTAQWRTQVKLNGVTRDKVMSLVDIEELAGLIRSKLGARMRVNKTMVRIVLFDSSDRQSSVDVKPQFFTGDPLPIVEYDLPETGKVQFELYRAPKIAGKRNGQVGVSEMVVDYPVTMKEFAAQAMGRKTLNVIGDALTALRSGYFEGIIRCEKIELHPDRGKFVANEALDMLYLLFDEWYTQYGSTQYEQEKELAQETRWQQLGLKSQDRIRECLRQPEFAKLWESLLDVVEVGRIGRGHITPPRGELGGTEEGLTVRTGQGGAGGNRANGPACSLPGPRGNTSLDKPPHDRPHDLPIGVHGTKGQKRRLVSGDSQGFMLGHQQMPGSSLLWEFDRTDGTLWFNTRHPVWSKLDETNGKSLPKNDRQIVHLMEWVSLEVLNLLLHYPTEEDFEQHRAVLDGMIRGYVGMFIAVT